MNIDIIYREAERGDYMGLKKLYKDIFCFDMTKDNYLKYIKDKDHIVLIALIGEEICGSICIERLWDAFHDELNYFLRNAGVSELWRKHGIFTELINLVMKRAKSENVKSIELTCADYRRDAHEFYLKHGFDKKKTTVFICETK